MLEGFCCSQQGRNARRFRRHLGPAGPRRDAPSSRHGDRRRLELWMEASHFVEADGPSAAFLPARRRIDSEWGPVWAESPRVPRRTRPSNCEVDDALHLHGLETAHSRKKKKFGEPAALFARLAALRVALGIATKGDSKASARAQARALGLEALCPFVVGYDSGPRLEAGARHDLGLRGAQRPRPAPDRHDRRFHPPTCTSARAAGVSRHRGADGTRLAAARAEVEPHADQSSGRSPSSRDLLDRLSAKAAPSLRPSA